MIYIGCSQQAYQYNEQNTCTQKQESEEELAVGHTCGWTIDPPAANEYAVLPEVVDKIKPSP